MGMAKQLVFFFLCTLLFFSASAFPYSEKDYPQRIISLGPDITEELYILGAEAKLVGCTVYCRRPPEAEKKEKVGSIIEISLEKVLALNPDLVLAISLTSPILKEKLKGLGIRVMTFNSPKSLREICEQFLELGRITGKEREAEEIILHVTQKNTSIKERTEGLKKPRVFVQIGIKPLVTINNNSFINDFIEYGGGINITKNLKNTHYSRERVLKDNPDVIIIATMGINCENEKKTWQKFKTLNAVKDDRIYFIDSELLCSPTPLSFVETLKEVSKILHPKILHPQDE